MAISDSGEWTHARRRIRRYLVVAMIVLVAASVLGVVGYFRWRLRTIGMLVPCVKTGQYEVGEILLRTTTDASRDLLIAPITEWDVARRELDGADLKPSGAMYRFTPGNGRISPAGLDDWSQATGEITYRYSKRDVPLDTPLVDVPTDTVSSSGTLLRTAGAYAFDVGESPDRRFVNVLSANARRQQGSFLFFMGGGGWPTGPYYHEIFERETGKKIGVTYTLEYAGQGVPQSYCWERQGKYVVYHDGKGRSLWIVPGPNHPGSETTLQGTSTGQQKQEKSDG